MIRRAVYFKQATVRRLCAYGTDSYITGGRGMLNVGRLNEGVVLDHIEAGKSMSIYKYLKLDKMDCCVAIIKNAHSNKMGKKDIIKVECPIDELDLNVLGFIDHRITVNIIQERNDRRKEGAESSEEAREYHLLQEPALYHFDRAGT